MQVHQLGTLKALPMAKVTVSIKHVAWRDGRPRFEPGPTVRALGFKGQDLKHPDGTWFTLAETQAWTATQIEAIAARRLGRPAQVKRSTLYTVEDLFDDLWKARRFKTAAQGRADGSLSLKTIGDYRLKAASLADFDPELYTSPAAAITKPIAKGLHEQLWEAKGLPMANGMIAVLRLAFTEAIERGRGELKINPCFALKLPTPKSRVRIGTAAEIEALMAAADATDPEIGDAIMLALYTGQRQGDVIHLCERNEAEGKIRFIQSKTNARVKMRALPQLMTRLTAARARKTALASTAETIVVDSRTGKTFNEHSFRHRFTALREKAAEACPSVASFWFMDLRDTAVTRLANAGCTIPEIGAITGHSMETIHSVLKHYLELNEGHADAAMDKMQAWLEREGIRL